MKVKTFRNILLAILAVFLVYRFWCPFSLEDIIFRNKDNMLFEYADIDVYAVILSVPLFAAAAVFFYRNRYNVMTKKGIWIMSLIFAFLILLPAASYPSRTEITSETITTHNFLGQPSKVYEIEDAKKVTVGLETVHHAARSGSSSNMWFVYSVEFEDGFTYDFGTVNDDKVWNEIIDSVNGTVNEKGIEKIIVGERYLDLDTYEALTGYDNYEEFIMPWLTRIENLMYE